MTIMHVTNLKYRDSHCKAGYDYLPGFGLSGPKYRDDCESWTTDSNLFLMHRVTEDKAYNSIAGSVSNYKHLLFSTAIYNQVISCSGGAVNLKTVIDKLKLAYPTIISVSDSLPCDLIYPLSIDSIVGTQVNGKLQITLNVSGNTPGKVRIVWGSLANVDIDTIDPAKIKSVTYERTLPAGAYLVCATVV